MVYLKIMFWLCLMHLLHNWSIKTIFFFFLDLRCGQPLAELGGKMGILISTHFFLLLDVCLPSHLTLEPLSLSLCLRFMCGILGTADYSQAQV